ncbi:unnamed protein product [Oreochromis niloticus]|nr:unnamed protein product [Mustela putorius furo]
MNIEFVLHDFMLDLDHADDNTGIFFFFLFQDGISSCCQRTSNTQIHRDLLKSYYIQQPPLCSIPAVVFTTISGRRICSDSTKTWTQTSMAYLDGKNWQKQNSTSKK